MLPVRQDIETETVFAEGELRVLAARLDADDDAVAAMTAWLSPEELERGRRCHFERDRRRFAVARALLRRLLGERLGAPPAAVALAAGANGKPMLRGTQAKSGWQFNVSRCGDLALFAFSPRCRVGVDVEAAREVRGADII
ncbi:MAG: 4'-phosphopantetheinyl transferase family protein, partial [Ignavibacteria bacterium]